MNSRITFGVLGLLLCCSTLTQAGVITTYATRAAFDAAVGSSTLEDFNSQTLGTSFKGTSFDVGDFTLLRTGSSFNGLFEFQGGSFLDIDGTTLGRVETGSTIGDLVFTFDAPITAFGIDTAAWNDRAIRTTVQADGMAVPVTSTPSTAVRFFGFSSDTAFSEVRFVGGLGDTWSFDNLSYAQSQSVVPEPSACLTFAVLGLCVGFSGRKRRD